jgi:hypothetical protein
MPEEHEKAGIKNNRGLPPSKRKFFPRVALLESKDPSKDFFLTGRMVLVNDAERTDKPISTNRLEIAEVY